jgi:hypothetical protein
MSSSRKADLRLDWCSHEAAKYAVEHWHYSRRMPRSKLAKVGVWETDTYIGAVIFGPGSCDRLGRAYGCNPQQACELLRVALTEHRAPVTRIVSQSLRIIRGAYPGLRLVVSYADPVQGHVGAIYQAGNWIYVGTSAPDTVYYDRAGVRHHSRNVKLRSYRDASGVVNHARSLMVRSEIVPGKHKYLMPLDDAMRAQIEPLRKPYPKKPSAGSVDSDTSTDQVEEGGVIPTPALHTCAVDNGQ